MSLNLIAARKYVRANKLENGLDVELLVDAINSVEKRMEYLKYFYILFTEATNDINLATDRIGVFKDGNGIMQRHKYEASAFAFLSTLHELIDSYPFIYLGIHQPRINNPKYLDWKKLNQLNKTTLLNKVFNFKNSTIFVKLDCINNLRKHRALPKVKNLFIDLEIDISNDGSGEFVNLKSLMIELHNNLIPDYFELLNLTFEINE